VEWSVASDDQGQKRFRLCWTETDGPQTGTIGEGGFGKVVLQRVAPAAINGEGTLEYHPNGIVWSLDAPLKYVEAKSEHADGLDRMDAIEDALL